ncbi:MAG: hypothetical protein ACREBU_16595 [Nitrososphaera sp.]
MSLTRVIVELNGQAQSMPWNSSKSALNPNHPVFVSLRAFLIGVVKEFASLSRRLEGNWQEAVLKYDSGPILDQEIYDFPATARSYLPELLKSKPRYADLIKQANRQLSSKKPWVTGLYEGVIAVDLILKQKLEQKNRIGLVLLDSIIEIGFKEYLVNESGESYAQSRLVDLFRTRSAVQAEIKKHVPSISNSFWKQIDYYYRLRSNLIHERAAAAISDSEVRDYRIIVQQVLNKLFKLRFEDY